MIAILFILPSCSPSETVPLQIGKILDGDSFYLNNGAGSIAVAIPSFSGVLFI